MKKKTAISARIADQSLNRYVTGGRVGARVLGDFPLFTRNLFKLLVIHVIYANNTVIIDHIIAIFRNVRWNRSGLGTLDNIYLGFICKYCKSQWMINEGNHGRADKKLVQSMWFRLSLIMERTKKVMSYGSHEASFYHVVVMCGSYQKNYVEEDWKFS